MYITIEKLLNLGTSSHSEQKSNTKLIQMKLYVKIVILIRGKYKYTKSRFGKYKYTKANLNTLSQGVNKICHFLENSALSSKRGKTNIQRTKISRDFLHTIKNII